METSSSSSAMGMSRWVKWTVGGVSGLDVGLSLALWFSAGHGDEEEYLREQVLGFGFLHSTFDLLLLSLIRNLAFITIFANLPLVFSWTSPNPRRRRRARRRASEAQEGEDEDEATPSIVDSRSHASPSSIRATLTSSALLVRGLTLLLPLSSLIYLIIKLSLAYTLLFSSSTESGPDEAPRRHGASEVAFNVALLCIAFISSAMELGLILHCFFRMNARAGEGQESQGRRLRRLKKAAGTGTGTGTELEAQGLLLDEEDEDEDYDEEGDDEEDSKEEDEGKKVEIKHASVGRLLVVASPERWLLIWGFVALLFSSATSLAIPAYFGQVLEAVVSPLENSRAELGRTMLSLTVIFAVGGVAQFAKEWLFTLAGQRLVARLRKDLLQAALRQEVAYFDTTRTGELTSRLSSDTTTLQSTLTENLFEFVSDILRTVGAVVLLFVTSTTLTLIMLGVVPLVGVGTMLYARYLEKLGKEFQDALAKASATAEEMISNIRTVRSFSREKRAHESYSKDIDESFRIGRRTALATGLFMGLVTFVGYSAIALVVYEGAIRVLNGTITSGTLTSFVLYTITLAESAGAMTYLFGEFMSAVGSTERIFELLDRKPAIPTEGGSKDVSMAMAKDPMEDESVSSGSSSVLLDNDTSIVELRSLDRPPREMMEGNAIAAPVLELRNVKFFYPSRPETIILNDVSLSLSRGTVTALVGPSGGGKSTIVSLIERFYDPVEGEVRFHGANIKDLDPVWYRKHLGLVSQEPVLFAGTIRENIMYGVKNASQQRIEEAARLANAHEFVMGFKDQYETVVGERGVRLSGGQKQRIAIARALLMDPEVLLLDEATSALDAESEHLVQEAIDRAMLNRTVLVVAHRLSTVRSASRVVVVGEGRIMESGTHDQLVNIPDGTYRKLVERQLQ